MFAFFYTMGFHLLLENAFVCDPTSKETLENSFSTLSICPNLRDEMREDCDNHDEYAENKDQRTLKPASHLIPRQHKRNKKRKKQKSLKNEKNGFDDKPSASISSVISEKAEVQETSQQCLIFKYLKDDDDGRSLGFKFLEYDLCDHNTAHFINPDKISPFRLSFVLARPLVTRNNRNGLNSILHMIFSIDSVITWLEDNAETFGIKLFENICQIKNIIYNQVKSIDQTCPKSFMMKYLQLITPLFRSVNETIKKFSPKKIQNLTLEDLFSVLTESIIKEEYKKRESANSLAPFQSLMYKYNECRNCYKKFIDPECILINGFDVNNGSGIHIENQLPDDTNPYKEGMCSNDHLCCAQIDLQPNSNKLFSLAPVLFLVIEQKAGVSAHKCTGIGGLPMKLKTGAKKYELRSFIVGHRDSAKKQFFSTFLLEEKAWYQQIDCQRKKILDIEYFLDRKVRIQIASYEMVDDE